MALAESGYTEICLTRTFIRDRRNGGVADVGLTSALGLRGGLQSLVRAGEFHQAGSGP